MDTSACEEEVAKDHAARPKEAVTERQPGSLHSGSMVQAIGDCRVEVLLDGVHWGGVTGFFIIATVIVIVVAVCQKPDMLKDRAKNDLEFAKLWEEDAFKAIVE